LNLQPTNIDSLFVIDTKPFGDHRGQFSRYFCDTELEGILQGRTIRQINHSMTTSPGAIRGMHFQNPPYAEMKLVRCLRGRVWDVAIDLRAGSETFLRWHAEELSAENRLMMAIPEGFAHGFQVLEPESELLYLHTAVYHRSSEGGVPFDDPRLAIRWPLPVTDVSVRDAQHPPITQHFTGIAINPSDRHIANR
jgi:dTDP-4-dehydrorhamnose 3,5-epimerase